MKKRLLSLVLAASLVLGSVTVYANDTVVAEPSDAVGVSDEVESAQSVQLGDDTQAYALETSPWATTSPWQATVYGDCGGQERVDNLGNPEYADYYHDESGNVIYPYEVVEDGSSVRVRMGVPSLIGYEDDAPASSLATGKIAGSTEGIVYYYQELSKDDDFTLSATANVNDVWTFNNQVSFGATVRDHVAPFSAATADRKPGSTITAGPTQTKNLRDGAGAMSFGYTRNSSNAITRYDSAATAVPKAGDSIPVSIKKAGDNYTITFGDDTTTVTAEEAGIAFEDDKIFAGFFASRAADVTFTNVKLSVAGAAVEVGDWEENGNGLNGQTKENATSDKLSLGSFTHNDDFSELSISVPDAGDGVGKFSNSEDSYYYTARKAPAGEDFTLKGTINVNAVDTITNPKQWAAGAIVFNKHYVKGATDETLKGQNGESFFVGLMSTDGSLVDVVYRSTDGAAAKVVQVAGTGASFGGNYGPYDIKIKKSDDILKVTIKDANGNVLTDSTGKAVGEVDLSLSELGLSFADNQYIGYCVARGGSINVTNNSLSVGSKKVESISIAQNPDKVDYYSTESFDYTGLKLNVKYTDGTTAVLDSADEDDYSEMSFTGFDEATSKSFTDVGNRVINVAVGAGTCELPVTVRPIKVTNIAVNYQPTNNEYVTGAQFNPAGLVAVATLEDGSVKTMAAANRAYTINGQEFAANGVFTDDMAGDTVIKLSYGGDDNIDPNGVYGDIPVTVKKATLQYIDIMTKPATTRFCVGDELNTAGLVVQAVYSIDGETSGKMVVLNEDEYHIEGFDSSAVTNSQTLTIVYNADPSKTVTYDVSIIEVAVLGTEIVYYPRLTYEVGEEFDPTGLSVEITYNNDTTKSLDRANYYVFDGSAYYAVDSDGTKTAVSESEAKAEMSYYIDLSNFSTAAVGRTAVKVVTSGYGEMDLVATVRDKSSYIWKATFFGASSLGVNENSEPSDMTLTKTDGSTFINNKEERNILPEVMTEGKLSGVEKVRLNSWNGAGKVSGDQDGIAYYYTRVDGSQNFKLSADITVNRYLMDPKNASDMAQIKAKQEELAKQGIIVDEIEAMDRLRSGQECFGIMARDVIPLAGGVYDGTYMGGITNHMTTDISKAAIDDYGEPVDLYNAWKGEPGDASKYVLTDSEGNTYRVTRDDVATTFASNIVIAGGCTDSTYPTDPTSSSYYRKSIMNRINIMVRTGVISPTGGGTRVGIKSTTKTVPVSGDKYNVTLQKLNNGFLITTYNYQTGETNTQYDKNSELDSDGVLNIQNEDNIWVGFFASRWADIDVSDITLYEIDPDTDLVDVPATEEIYSPTVQVGSPLYTTKTDYNLYAKVNNPSGGYATISVNDKVVHSNVIMSKRYASYPITLTPNSVNNVTIAYTPSTADNCSSYATVISRYQITCTAINDITALYVSPDGSVQTGDGSREKPIDLESAIGFSDLGTNIIMLDGTYHIRNTDKAGISIGELQSGAATNRKVIRADEGAHPVLDLEGQYAGISCAGSYWTFDGFEITNSGPNMKPFQVGGNNCVVKNLTSHHNQDTGIQISRLINNQYTIDTWPANNLIIDCESFDNCDPAMQNADGMAAKLTVGYGNVFEDCISHHNLDDGWDCYTKLSTGAIGPVTLENCIAYRNGVELLDDGSEVAYASATASGNGFKLGGEDIMVAHYLKDAKTFDNRANGVDSNNNPGFKMRNVIAHNNAYNFALYTGSGVVLYDSKGSTRDEQRRPYKFNYDVKGAVSITGNNADKIGSLTDATEFGNANDTPLESLSNYWIYSNNTTAVAKDVSYEGTSKVVNQEVALDVDALIKSTNKFDSIDSTTKRYRRNNDGTFYHGDYLARTTEYVHDEGDEVVLPDQGGDTPKPTPTPSESTQATTSESKHGGGGGGGGGAGRVNATSTTTTEATTTATGGDDATEATTEEVDVVTSATIDLPNEIDPPKASGDFNGFVDIEGLAWAKDAINTLASAGIVSGTSSDHYSPRLNTKRADMIVMIVNALGLTSDSTDNFDDVSRNAYYAGALATAKYYGIATGYPDGTFAPEEYITRQDAMVLIAKTYEALGADLDGDTSVVDRFVDGADVSEYAREYVAKLVNEGVVFGDNNSKINPKQNITRAEMAVLINALYDEATEVAANVAAEKAEAAAKAEEEAKAAEEEAAKEEETNEEGSEETTEGTTEETTSETTTAAK